jgi:hypothetical protein
MAGRPTKQAPAAGEDDKVPTPEEVATQLREEEKEEKHLTVPGSKEVAAPEAIGRGFEEPTEQQDILIPRCKLLQSVSEEVQDGLEGCRPGVLVNSLTKELLPDVFIPIFKFTEYMKFNPRREDDPGFDSAYEKGALIWRFTDPRDPRVAECEFESDGTKPVGMKLMNFLAYFPGTEMPVVISFNKSSYGAGRKLISLCQFQGGDMFGRKYRLLTKQKEANGTKFFVLDVANMGKANKEEFKVAETWFASFRKQPIDVDASHESVADAGAQSAE